VIIAKIEVDGVIAKLVQSNIIPKGIIGGKVQIQYKDPLWNDLQKTVVFRSTVTKDVIDAREEVEIPIEVVSTEGVNLFVAIYGTNDNKNIALPTLWVDLGKVLSAAEPSGDSSTDPTLPVWAQLSQQYEHLLNLELHPPKADWNASENSDGHILNRTHWSETIETNSTFDGNLEGRELIDGGDGIYLVKMSNTTITAEELIGKKISAYVQGEQPETQEAEITEDMIEDLSSSGIPVLCVAELVWVISEDFETEGVQFPKGTYFTCIKESENPVAYVRSVSDLSFAEEVIHKLDQKYLDVEWMAKSKEGTELLLDETKQLFSSNRSDKSTCNQRFDFPIYAGEKYRVLWDGQEYECCAVSLMKNIVNYIGNCSIYDKEYEDTGEPFCILSFVWRDFYATTTIYGNNDAEEHTVGVWYSGNIPERIPYKFLPSAYVLPSDLKTEINYIELEKGYEKLRLGSPVFATYNNSLYKVLFIRCDFVDSMYYDLCIVNGREIRFWDNAHGWTRFGYDGFTISSSANGIVTDRKYKFTVDENGNLVSTDVSNS